MRIRIDYTTNGSNETYVITIVSNLSTPGEIQEFWSE